MIPGGQRGADKFNATVRIAMKKAGSTRCIPKRRRTWKPSCTVWIRIVTIDAN
jgi:hypothetical protein